MPKFFKFALSVKCQDAVVVPAIGAGMNRVSASRPTANAPKKSLESAAQY
jgi:hypothetical protein